MTHYYTRRATDIVAYTYQAGIHCIDCIGGKFRGLPSMMALNFEATEKILDVAASELGIDRYDEHSFDSEDFPKVVHSSSANDDGYEHCDTCGDCIDHDERDCEQSEDDDETGCDGHESLDGAHMGETVYCDGSCNA